MLEKRKKLSSISRKHILQYVTDIKVRCVNLSLGELILLIGIFFISVSLFLPWFSLTYTNEVVYSSFSKIIGVNGVYFVIIICINILNIFSHFLKQKLFFLMNYSIAYHSIFLVSSIILLLLCGNTFIILNGLQTISSSVTLYSGINFCLIGSIIFLSGSLIIQKGKRNVGHIISIKNSPYNKEVAKKENKKNTKLPF